jgi:acyl-CoA thioester hydrolase
MITTKKFAVTITPRFYETDALGHVNNASIAAWFEVARIRFLESLGEDKPETAANWVLANINIDFVLETFYGKDVEAVITGAEVGNSSVTVVCEMTQSGRVTVRGRAVLVHRDPVAKKSTRVPDGLRRALAAFTG